MLEAAREAAAEAGLASDNHHFAVAQLPMNLFEHAPLTIRKEGAAADRSTLGFARESDVGVLVNRPLNAYAQGEMIRLADFHMDPPSRPLAKSLEQVALLEKEFLNEFGKELRLGSDGPRPADLFPWGRQLAGLAGKVGGYEHWQSIQQQQIQPHLFHAVSYLKSSLSGDQESAFRSWLDRYLPAMEALLAAFRFESAAMSQKRSDRIASLIDPGLPLPLRSESLSRKALHAVASAEGVTCVLNGMRHPLYVEDALPILSWERLASAADLFGKL
jgi:hypothetical protein